MPTPGCEVRGLDGAILGKVTSGCISPAHGRGLALALLRADAVRPGTRLHIIIQGHPVPAVVADIALQ